jgi:hypothetical protein
MKTLIDFDQIIAYAIKTGAHTEDYSYQFWDAFDNLHPEITNKYAIALEKLNKDTQ